MKEASQGRKHKGGRTEDKAEAAACSGGRSQLWQLFVKTQKVEDRSLILHCQPDRRNDDKGRRPPQNGWRQQCDVGGSAHDIKRQPRDIEKAVIDDIYRGRSFQQTG